MRSSPRPRVRDRRARWERLRGRQRPGRIGASAADDGGGAKKYFGHFRTLDHDQKDRSASSTVKFLSKAALPLSSVQLSSRDVPGAQSLTGAAYRGRNARRVRDDQGSRKTPVTPSITPIASTSARRDRPTRVWPSWMKTSFPAWSSVKASGAPVASSCSTIPP